MFMIKRTILNAFSGMMKTMRDNKILTENKQFLLRSGNIEFSIVAKRVKRSVESDDYVSVNPEYVTYK